jgi:hypothetical protein
MFPLRNVRNGILLIKKVLKNCFCKKFRGILFSEEKNVQKIVLKSLYKLAMFRYIHTCVVLSNRHALLLSSLVALSQLSHCTEYRQFWSNEIMQKHIKIDFNSLLQLEEIKNRIKITTHIFK